MASTVHVVSLSDLESKVPRWDPSSSSHLYALVDMGSNGIRFSISDLSPPYSRLLKCVYREREGISLFDALDTRDNNDASESNDGEKSFSAVTIRRVSLVVSRFRAIALSYGVPRENMYIFATEAMRSSSNATAMIQVINEQAPGVAMFIIDPEVENLFGSMGARSTFTSVKGLFLDLGGGSVQMTYMDTTHARTSNVVPSYEMSAAQTGQSLPFGAARLIKILNANEVSVTKKTKKDLASGMLNAFAKLSAMFPDLARAARKEPGSPGVNIYLCGGGFRGYGSMLMHNDPIQPYPIPLIGGYCVPGSFFRDTKRMLKINQSFEGKIYGMSNRRRQQFPAVVAVVDALVAAIPQIASVTFCAGGNREGALMMKLPRNIRESDPLKLVQFSTLTSTPTTSAPSTAPDELTTTLASTITSALPINLIHDEIFASTIIHHLIPHIWLQTGEDNDAATAAALHAAVNANPSVPGLGHQARASLAVAVCARWDGNFAPTDKVLMTNLRRLLGGDGSQRCFWAEYLGAVAAVLALVMPRMPVTSKEVRETVRFEGEMFLSGGQREMRVKVFVKVDAARGLEMSDVKGCFDAVGKMGGGEEDEKEGRRGDGDMGRTKVTVEVHELANADDAAVAASGTGEPW